MQNTEFLILVISILLTFFTLKISIPYLNKFFIDKPNLRSSHDKPKARAGGIVFVIYGTIFCFLQNLYIPLICLPLAVVGLIDDRFNLSSKIRFFSQVLTVFALFRFLNLNIYFDNQLFEISIVIILFISGLAIINFTNFMDGIDGIVSACMLIILSVSTIEISASLFPMIGVLIGFLILNWSPAKVFMGDVGSTFLGALFFGILLQASSWEQFFGCLLVSTPLFGDAIICVFRRFFNKENIFQPHSSHLYQRLFKAGLKHDQITIIYSTAIFLISSGWLIGGIKYVLILSTLVIAFGIWLDQKIAIPFKQR